MGVEDMMNQAKDALAGATGAVSDEQIDTVADAVKEHAPEQAHSLVDKVADAAKDAQ